MVLLDVVTDSEVVRLDVVELVRCVFLLDFAEVFFPGMIFSSFGLT